MNTSTPSFVQNTLAKNAEKKARVPIQYLAASRSIMIILLSLMILLSALMLIYVKTLQREQYSRIQSAQQKQERLHARQSQLLLEKNTLAAPQRIEIIAHQQLGMVFPTEKNTIKLSDAMH
jgi:cell division protein FtsL